MKKKYIVSIIIVLIIGLIISVIGDNDIFPLNEPVEEDLRFPASAIKTQGAVNVPNFEVFRPNTYSYTFSQSIMQQAYVTAQIPHSRAENTKIEPHFHWSQVGVNNGNVVWCVEYTWANINEIFPTTETKCITDTADGTSYKHYMTEMIEINGNNKSLSSMLNMRIYRDVTNINDTLNEKAYLLEFDIHYYANKLGENR